jgi:Zn-dependent protease with chaperone function
MPLVLFLTGFLIVIEIITNYITQNITDLFNFIRLESGLMTLELYIIYVLVFYILRRNEYLADKGSIKLGNKSLDFANALRRLDKNYDKKKGILYELSENFDTHPLTWKRIERVLNNK